jgi:hypothetical protein
MEPPRMHICCNCGASCFSIPPRREALCGDCYEKWQAGQLPGLTDEQLYPPDDPPPPLPSNATELLDYCRERQREYADWPDNDHPFIVSAVRDSLVDAVKQWFRKLNLALPQGEPRTVEECRCWLDEAVERAEKAAKAQLAVAPACSSCFRVLAVNC